MTGTMPRISFGHNSARGLLDELLLNAERPRPQCVRLGADGDENIFARLSDHATDVWHELDTQLPHCYSVILSRSVLLVRSAFSLVVMDCLSNRVCTRPCQSPG